MSSKKSPARGVSVVVRREPLARMLKGLLVHLPRKVSEEDAGRGLGVVRLVVSLDVLLGLAVSVDESTAVCTSAPVVEMDDVERVEAWLSRAAVEAVSTVASAGSSDDVELVVDEGRLLEAREVGVLWGGRVVRVPLEAAPSSPSRACAARMLVQASSASLEAVAQMWVEPRDVARMARTAGALGEPLRVRLGRSGSEARAVAVWGYGRCSDDTGASSYLAVTDALTLRGQEQAPALGQACYDGLLLEPLVGAVLDDLSGRVTESVESRFVLAVESFLGGVSTADGLGATDGAGSRSPSDAAAEGLEGSEGGEHE